LIKRIAEATNWPTAKKERLEEITLRLGPINKLRNDILHYGVTLDMSAEDSWLLSNKDSVHIPEKIRETSITPALLEDACSDLKKILGLLMLLTIHDRMPNSAKSLEATFEAPPLRLKDAWLYKPPRPAVKSAKSQKIRQKRSR
jgi:hypothetical protein